MSTTLPLTDDEYDRLLSVIWNPRDRCLVILGCYTGFRISELLSLTIGDVFAHGQVLATVTVPYSRMKGKRRARSCTLSIAPQNAVATWLARLRSERPLHPDVPLFLSQRLTPSGAMRAMTRERAYQMLAGYCEEAKIPGCRGTHTLRKTFATTVYAAFDRDLRKTQLALGHASISSTAHYLSSCCDEVQETIQTITIGANEKGSTNDAAQIELFEEGIHRAQGDDAGSHSRVLQFRGRS